MTAALELAPEIRATNAAFIAAFTEGDVAHLAAVYQRGAQLLPTHGSLVTGPTAIEAYWRGVREMDVQEMRREFAEVYQSVNTVIAIGEFEFRSGDGFTIEHGTCVTVWRDHQDGWKLYRDIWNADSWSDEVTTALDGP